MRGCYLKLTKNKDIFIIINSILLNINSIIKSQSIQLFCKYNIYVLKNYFIMVFIYFIYLLISG